ncbi:alpha/beta-hydrolase [Leucogyrophana mollusca]|uniref:Alpha/beta-hydrolase n=1 Tax=Leucogyrophana mollusca TaxID=85980 RepID=A0ACB8B8I8_9AGAM|nr:alpha/beta-hydrolase [Leucogyrophana mollusca]
MRTDSITNSPVLAGSPGSCCLTGVKHTGTAAGRSVHIGGMDTYVSEPKHQGTQKKIILFFADVFGPFWINNQLVQDYFASYGFTVLGPDYFFGFGVVNHPPGYDSNGWIDTTIMPAWDAFPAWIDAVKKLYGTENTSYCTVGYCFGGPFAMHLVAEDWITAAAIAHPAFLEESHFENAKKVDDCFPVESRRRAEDIMVKRDGTYHFQLFSHVNHGFSVRANPNIEPERWAREECARGMKEWFIRFTRSQTAE